MSQTPAKMSLRARYKELEKFTNQLKLNSENATLVANAGFWKLGFTNRDQCKAMVDEYLEHMKAKIAKIKEEGSLEVIENFLDPQILAKAEGRFDDTDSSTIFFDEPNGDQQAPIANE